MKEKEPNELFFSADESPVPLPSVEDAWSDMRKKLDEEMPERAAFFIWRKAGLIAALILLSLCIFWLLERHRQAAHPAPQTIVAPKDSQGAAAAERGTAGPAAGAGAAQAGRQVAKSANGFQQEMAGGKETITLPKTGTGKIGHPAEPGKTGRPREQAGQIHETGTAIQETGAAIHENSSGTRETVTASHQTSTAAYKTGSATHENGTAEATHQNGHDMVGLGSEGAPGNRSKGSATTGAGNKVMEGRDGGHSIIDPTIPRIGRPDTIRVWVNMPNRVAGIPGKIAAPPKRNVPKPEEPKKVAAGDSTRILWAAGLQDSKSFPVDAQQPVDYNANLKKDLWFDYIPSPYFQYFMSRKIGFQFGLQFNSPQYTESVSIYRTPPPVSNATGSTVMDTVLVVKKLYYLSLPLTVYYSPFRNLYLGAGLQYSNLSNGVALQNNVTHYTGGGGALRQPDTVTSSKLISLKDYRPAYSNLKKTDWRALFELDYYWKRLTLGVQYQQGLGDYLYTPVDGSTGKDRNSSFNVYLRYNIWERRIKIARR